jgi:hypothetical protein
MRALGDVALCLLLWFGKFPHAIDPNIVNPRRGLSNAQKC